MANLAEWAKTVVGRYIDVDNWAGNQCWDLAQLWLTVCNGGTLWTQPSRFPGLAAGSWEVATRGTENTEDLLRHVTPIPGTERGMPGDLIIWAYGSADYPISHTAVLIEDRGPILSSLSQNSSPARPDLPGYSVESSGPTIYQDLPRAGILGFLRPRAIITGQGSGITPIPSEEEEIMAALDTIMARLDQVVDWLNAKFGANASRQDQIVEWAAANFKALAAGNQQVLGELDRKYADLMTSPAKEQLVKGDTDATVYAWDGGSGYRALSYPEFLALTKTGATLQVLPQDTLDAAVKR